MKTFVLLALTLFLGAVRANLTPDAPTRGICYHGCGGNSGR